VPTRELALQVGAAFKIFRRLGLGADGAGEAGNYHTIVLYGGANKEDQISEAMVYMQNTADIDIVVATPGRLLDLLTTHSHSISLRRVTYFVLDEGDKMLDLGFTEQIGAIAAQIRPDRQTLLFSATFPGRLREVADTWMGDKEDSVIVRCHGLEMSSQAKEAGAAAQGAEANTEKSMNICDLLAGVGDSSGPSIDDLLALAAAPKPAEQSAAPSDSGRKGSTLTVNRDIKQSIHVCATHKKPRLLLRYIETVREQEKAQKARQPAQILIFCNKTKSIGFVLDFLKKQNVVCDKLCGSMQQSMRERVLANFKAGKVNVLLATDVAARGIHIKRLKHVVNYDFPSNLEQYCHRVGRTGRDNKTESDGAPAPAADGEESVAAVEPTGYAYSFFTRNLAPVANDLIALLEKCNQVVEPNLSTLATEYRRGEIIVDSVEQQSGDEGEDADFEE
jgi:ATP-dependent RNA helicase DDX5/DBP2